MKNIPLLIGTIVGSLILVLVVAMSFSGGSSAPGSYDPVAVAGDARHVKGANENYQVTIVEFSDFQCPACRAAQPLVEQLTSQYPDQVRLIYRHFPLTSHPHAQLAAEASEYAADQGKFWKMHDLLFERQPEWSQLNRDEVMTTFESYLEELEIDKTDFSSRIEEKAYEATVLQDLAAGERFNVTGTPSFYVDGVKTSAPELIETVESKLTTNE